MFTQYIKLMGKSKPCGRGFQPRFLNHVCREMHTSKSLDEVNPENPENLEILVQTKKQKFA